MASNSDDGNHNNFSLMQHLIDEMDASNHRIDLFSKKFDGEVNKYSVGPTGKSSMEHHFETLYDDAWKSEESDVASLQELPVHFSLNDAGDSGCEEVVNSAIAEVSNDFLSGFRHSSAQNQCPDSDESRISSDNDFKRLTGMASYARYPETATGLSDTDWNPYGTESDNNPSPRLQPQENGSDSKSSLLTSFTPLLNSTDINTVSPNSPLKISHLNNERMSDILEQTERENTLTSCLIPNTSTGISHTDSTLKSVYTPFAVPTKLEKFDDWRHDNKKEKELSSSKDSISSDEEKRMMASTSSTGYSSATSGIKIQGNNTGLSSKPLSVIERAKLMGIPEDILLDNNSKNQLSKTRQFHPNFLNTRDYDNESDDQLGKKVRTLLSDTTHLSTYDKVHSSSENSSNVDYTVLQRDLQEIQDNLDSFGVNLQENKSGKRVGKSPASSDGEDIIPSTTTTPERRKEKMVWDFAGDIGVLGNHQGVGMMEEISLDTHTTSSQRPSTEKPFYNSDGDETRTSESSTKADDHAAADLALAEMSEILHPSMRDLDTSTDVDHMVSNFQHKRRQLESRYQELNNQGLAEKVYRILTNQNPESQANGILSEISADEKELRTKMVLNSHDKKFNYSSTSSWLEELNQSNQSFNPTGDVRKKLDMSGLSSVDSSWMFDKSASKGFSALDDAKRLLSSQMMKASERTFNHSMEMRVPQSIHCYPLLVGNADENGTEKESQVQQNNGRHKVDETLDQGTERFGSQQNERDRCNSATHHQEHTDELVKSNTSPNSSDQGTSMRPKDKYRPYRPPGSKEVYYTESDTASVADSVTTMESTHIGSDDARGPSLPSHVMGSRKDPPNVAGIYSAQLNLSTVREDTELATIDEKSENNSELRNHSRRETDGSPNAPSMDTKKKETSEHSETHKYTPSTRVKREDQPDEINQRRRYDFSARDDFERTTNVSPTRGIAAARRDARWALRRDELNRESLDEKYESVRAHNRLGTNRQGINEEGSTRMDYDTPKSHLHFEDGRVQDDKENEPLSLRIRMTYTDENNLKDRRRNADQTAQSHSEPEPLSNIGKSRFTERDAYRFDRYSPEMRNTRSSTYETSDSLYHRHCPDENIGSMDSRLSPAFRHALSPDGQNGLARAASDENLSSTGRDARLSPAFRRALSPDLRNSIERRSPLLSRHLERSLAQPPSDFPSGNKATIDDRYNFRSERPTFLARERPLSPREYMRLPTGENPSMLRFTTGSDTRLRPRSVSPTYSERNSFRHGDHNERQREGGVNLEDVQNQNRVVVTQSQPTVKRKVELTLEGMSSESEADLEMDQKPISKRAQLLKSALANEGEPSTNYDINAMWEKFKAMNDSSNSSINSSRIEAVADLLKSPSRHLVSQYVKDREEYRIERQERAEIERERRLREQQMQKHSSSEDEINERYAELLAIKEEERLKRRASKKKKGKVMNSAADAEKKNEKDSLFSIPEDRSHEPTPTKTNTPSKHQKPKGARQTHVIDPNMLKLRERIAKQKTKVDKDMMKEMRRIEKLKKLESLLTAKKKGKITNETLQTQLDELSSTSAVVSDFSHESAKDDSTTAKDSSAEMHAWKAEKERRKKEFEMQKQSEGRRTGLKEQNNSHFTNGLFSQAPELTEIRLLKLVKEGYLTAEEAYKLAIDRASHETMDSSRDSSNNSYHGKRHKLYSPYSRSSSHLSQMQHVPKLKFSGTVPHSSYGIEEFEIDPQQSMRKARRAERKPKSHSPAPGTKFSPAKRQKSLSPVSRQHASPSAARRHYSASPPRQLISGSHGQHYSRKAKQNFLQSKKYVSENDLPRNDKGQIMKGSVAWQIPMDLHPSQWKEPLPKQQPLREVTSSFTNKPRKQKHADAFHGVAMGDRKGGQDYNDTEANIWTKPNHPPGIPKLQWEKVVSSDALASKSNHWEVDPLMDRVQYILNKQDGDQSQQSAMSGDGDNYKKPIPKLSLQDAFYSKKQNFISKCSERQKRMKLAKDDRHLQECLRLEREAIFAEQERLAPPNLYAHPYSDNLYQPKHRILTKQEMKTLTARRYNKLPEVIEKKEEDKKKIEARLNKLRANLFNKKVQRNVLRKLRC